MAKERDKGEGAGGGCAPSCAEREAKTTSILQSEWKAKKRSIATLLKILQIEFLLSPVTINIFH
jgi:hypothetical protein